MGLHAQELRPVRSAPGTAGVVVLAVVCAQLGMNVSWCLVVLMLAPVVTVLGYETMGHRHLADWHGTDSCDRVDARVERDACLRCGQAEIRPA